MADRKPRVVSALDKPRIDSTKSLSKSADVVSESAKSKADSTSHIKLDEIARSAVNCDAWGEKTKGVYSTSDDPYEPMRVAEDNLAYQYESDPYGIDGFNYDPGYSYRGKKQGEFTIDDIMALPEGVRVELIDGRIYDMAPPTTIHQVIAQQMLVQISIGVEKNNGECVTLISPVGVKLNAEDDKNYLEPDIIVVCDRNKIRSDMVYHFESLRMTKSYSFADTVPIEIFEGKVSIDFSRISKQLDTLFG